MSTVSLKYGMVTSDTVPVIARYRELHSPHYAIIIRDDRVFIENTDQICVHGSNVLFAQHDNAAYHQAGNKALSVPQHATTAWQGGHRFIQTEGFLNVMHVIDQHMTSGVMNGANNMRYGMKIWDVCTFEGALKKPVGTFASIYQISNSTGLKSAALTHQGVHFMLQTMFDRPALTHFKTLDINATMMGHATYNKVTIDNGMPDVSICGRHFAAADPRPLQEERFYTVPPPYHFVPKNLYSDTIHNILNKTVNRDNMNRVGFPQY